MADVASPYAEHLLPANSTAIERVFAAAVNSRTAAIPIPLRLLNDPYKVPAEFINHLAFEVGVDIWNEDWTELKKRSTIATTIRVKEILGTIGGISAYVAMELANVVDVVVPPQTPFVSKALTDDQYAAWLGLLPQLRVYFGDDQSKIIVGQSFVGSSFVGKATLTPDKGRDLLGRQAFYYDPATEVETRITLADLGVSDNPDVVGTSERAFVTGQADSTDFFIGKSFVGEGFITTPAAPPKTVSYTLADDGSNSLNAGALALTMAASFDPVNTRFDRISVFKHRSREQSFVGVDFIGHGFVSRSTAMVNFYDRLYLADPTIHAPVTVGTTYIGHSRLQMDAYRAEMLIDAQETTAPTTAFEGRFIDNCFVLRQDDTKRKRILQAIEMAKAGRDRVFVDFAVTTVLSFADAPAFDGLTAFGQRQPRYKL